MFNYSEIYYVSVKIIACIKCYHWIYEYSILSLFYGSNIK